MTAKKIVILSGKGGTGKTSLSAALSHLAASDLSAREVVLVDADVDAANLKLVLKTTPSEKKEFWGGGIAVIDPAKCVNCDKCYQVCRYDAVIPPIENKNAYSIDPIACDGCAACVYVCQNHAIEMIPQQEGVWFQSDSAYGILFHAELFPGRENSGKLVTLIKQNAVLFAEDSKAQLIIIDGPPGIGCPVIAACAGVDFGLLVTEPGISAMHDLKRIHATLRHFKIPVGICINKADIYPHGTEEIFQYAHDEKIEVFGEIPFDECVPLSIMREKPVTDAFNDSPAAKTIKEIWIRLQEMMK